MSDFDKLMVVGFVSLVIGIWAGLKAGDNELNIRYAEECEPKATE